MANDTLYLTTSNTNKKPGKVHTFSVYTPKLITDCFHKSALISNVVNVA